MGDVNTSTNTLFYLSLTLLLLLTQVWVNVLQSTTTFVCHFRPFPIIFCNVFFFGVTRVRPSRQCYCFAANDDPTSSKLFERKWDDNEWLEIARAIGIVLIFDASNCWRIPRLIHPYVGDGVLPSQDYSFIDCIAFPDDGAAKRFAYLFVNEVT